MEEKKEKMSKEEQIKIIDGLIESNKKYRDDVNKAIKDLDDSVCPHILEDLGFQFERATHSIADLERMKDAILNQGLGNEYAERAFGVY